MERRILIKASKHNLPGRRTSKFQDLVPESQSAIRSIAGEKMQGRPVLVFFDSRERWTLLTTREVIGWMDGSVRAMSIEDMVAVGSKSHPPDGASMEEVTRWKMSWEHLRVADFHGVEAVVWVPCGGEAYALWNILLPYVRGKEKANLSEDQA